jgi:hypothetical protein
MAPAPITSPPQTTVNGRAPTDSRGPAVAKKEMGTWAQRLIPTGLLSLAVLDFTQLVALWPAVVNATPGTNADGTSIPVVEPIGSTLFLGLWHARLDPDAALVIMVALVGLLGAVMTSAWRFQNYAHLGQLTARDAWSYAVVPLQGAMLALVVYFTLRGGFLGTDSSAPLNPYGIAAIAGLVGLFTRNAMTKLREIMKTLFGETQQPSVRSSHHAGSPE